MTDVRSEHREVVPLLAFVGGTVFWWAWILGLLVIFLVTLLSVAIVETYSVLLLFGENARFPAWYLPANVVLSLLFAGFLVFAGWLGARAAARLRLMPALWWAPSLLAMIAWLALVTPYAILRYVINARSLPQVLLAILLLIAAYGPLLLGQYLAARDRALRDWRPSSPRLPAPVGTAAAASASVAAYFEGGAESHAARDARAMWGVKENAPGERHAFGLWPAIEDDRLRVAALILAAAAPFFLVAWLVWSGARGRGDGPVVSVVEATLVLVAMLAVIAVGAIKLKRNDAQLPVAMPAVGTLLDSTQAALDSLALAAGGINPELWFFDSAAVNAYYVRRRGGVRIAVSRGFTALPQDEQVAGLALLLGRSRVVLLGRDVEPYLRETFTTLASAVNVSNAAAVDRTLKTWLSVAMAGDHEGLLILKDPQPMVRLLQRLSGSDSAVRTAPGGEDQLFEYLAWPCPRGDGSQDPTANPEEIRLREILAISHLPQP